MDTPRSSWFNARLYFFLIPFAGFLPLPHRTNIPLYRKPVVTITLIWVNFIFFLFSFFSGHLETIAYHLGYIPIENRVITLLTYQFIHGGFLHVLGNMFFLWIFGCNVEDRMGRLAFLVFYLTCGVASVLFWVTVSHLSNPAMPLIGASGAVYGVMGAFFVLFPFGELKITCVIMLLMIYWRLVTFWCAALFLAPFFVLTNILLHSIDLQGQVAYMAHLGGFLFAIPAGMLYRHLFYEPKPPPKPDTLILEEDQPPKEPETEQERLQRDLKMALYDRRRKDAVRIYDSLREHSGSIGLIPVDNLQLAEAFEWEKDYLKAKEVYLQLANNAEIDPDLRSRAALGLAKLYIHHLGNIPLGVKTLRTALKHFPQATPADLLKRELQEIQLMGAPVEPEKGQSE